jgi:hypothetical protein
MRAVIVVNLGVTPIHPGPIRPADLNRIGSFPAEEFLAEPDMDFGWGHRDDRTGGRVGTFNIAVGAGQRVPNQDISEQHQQKTKRCHFKAQIYHKTIFLLAMLKRRATENHLRYGYAYSG